MVFEIIATLLVVASILVGLLGLLFASEATIGVALVGCACLIAIIARIAQAVALHRRP